MITLALIVLLLATAVLIALLEDLVGVIIAFAACSLALALIWTVLAAPDVALAEAAIGAGLMSVLFLFTVGKTTSGPVGDIDVGARALRPVNWPLVALLLVLAVPLGASLRKLPSVGAPDAMAVRAVYADGSLTPYGYYVEQTVVETGFPNAVVAILTVFRNFDTFGELIVIFGAAVGVLVVLGREDLK